MTKNFDSDPDINQLQFILYQYGRQGSRNRTVLPPSDPARSTTRVRRSLLLGLVISSKKQKNLESDLDEFNIKDFVYRKRDLYF